MSHSTCHIQVIIQSEVNHVNFCINLFFFCLPHSNNHQFNAEITKFELNCNFNHYNSTVYMCLLYCYFNKINFVFMSHSMIIILTVVVMMRSLSKN